MRHQKTRLIHGLLSIVTLSAASLTVAGSALAAPINYGNFSGVTVDYLQVTEDSNSPGDLPPLFGAPEVTGDSIDFDPIGFSASSANGAADLTDGQLFFTVVSKGQSRIKNINFAEAGDTSLLGIGTDATFTSVTTTVFVDITEVDGTPISVVSAGPLNMTFSPSGGTYGLGTDGGGGPSFATGWSGNILLDIEAMLTAAGVPFVGGATKVDVNLDNTLSALSQTNTQSLIAKKNANGVVITVNIPEPSSCLMAAMALVGLGVRRRLA